MHAVQLDGSAAAHAPERHSAWGRCRYRLPWVGCDISADMLRLASQLLHAEHTLASASSTAGHTAPQAAAQPGTGPERAAAAARDGACDGASAQGQGDAGASGWRSAVQAAACAELARQRHMTRSLGAHGNHKLPRGMPADAHAHGTSGLKDLLWEPHPPDSGCSTHVPGAGDGASGLHAAAGGGAASHAPVYGCHGLYQVDIGSGLPAEWPSSYFSAAISISALQWLLFRPDAAAALTRFFTDLRRVLRPGGVAVLQAYVQASHQRPHQRAQQRSTAWPISAAQHPWPMAYGHMGTCGPVPLFPAPCMHACSSS